MNKLVIILFGLTISGFLSILLIESQTITATYKLEMGEQITVPGSLGDHTINFQGYNRLILDGEKKLVYQGDCIGDFVIIEIHTRMLVVQVKTVKRKLLFR